MRRAIVGAVLRFLLILLLFAALLALTSSPWALGGLILLLLLPLAFLVRDLRAKNRFHVDLAMPSSTAKGQTLAASVRMKGLLPLGQVWCRLQAKNDLTGEETELPLTLTVRDGALCGQASLTANCCGRLRVKVQRLVVLDFFLPLSCAADAETKCTVLPDTFPVALQPELLSAQALESDMTENILRGNDPTELFQLREYQAGDRLRGIHWKLSAKLDALIYREPSQPVDCSLLVYWDRQGGTPAVRDALAEVVFSTCQALTEAGRPFFLGFAEGGESRLEKIDGQDALLQKLPPLLRSGVEQGPLPDFSSFGRTLLFTTVPPEYSMGKSVLTLCCQETAGEDKNCFTPESCRETLQRLEV